MKKRFLVYGIAAVMVLPLFLICLSMGTANAWQPDKPVEFVVPAGTGGGADVMARFVSPLISKYKLSPNTLDRHQQIGRCGRRGVYVCEGEKRGSQ